MKSYNYRVYIRIESRENLKSEWHVNCMSGVSETYNDRNSRKQTSGWVELLFLGEKFLMFAYCSFWDGTPVTDDDAYKMHTWHEKTQVLIVKNDKIVR